MIVGLLTIMSAAPPPWTRRNTISSVAPCEIPQSAEPMVKTTKPRLYIRTRPSMSATRPNVSRNTVLIRMYAMMTQTISIRSACSFTIMSGSASMTMVLSIAAINAPMVVTLRAIHL